MDHTFREYLGGRLSPSHYAVVGLFAFPILPSIIMLTDSYTKWFFGFNELSAYTIFVAAYLLGSIAFILLLNLSLLFATYNYSRLNDGVLPNILWLIGLTHTFIVVLTSIIFGQQILWQIAVSMGGHREVFLLSV